MVDYSTLNLMRHQNPLILVLTNEVTMNFCADTLSAIGASPVMSRDAADAAELAGAAQALVINIGTVNTHFMETARAALDVAQHRKIPVILDPVGVGATKARYEAASELLSSGAVSMIRANFSEITALIHGKADSKGVDAVISSLDRKALSTYAAKDRLTLAITGKTDWVTDGTQMLRLDNGLPLLKNISGTGCITSALCGAFAAVTTGANAAAMAILSITLAAEKSIGVKGPGSLKSALTDQLYHLKEEDFSARGKVFYETT